MSSKPDRSNTTSDMTKPKTPEHNSVKNDKKKKSIVKKIFSSKRKNGRSPDEVVIDLERRIASKKAASTTMRKTLSEKETTNSSIEGLNLSTFERPMIPVAEVEDFRIFVATWNVGGKTPNNSLNLEDFLQVEGTSDIYVLGFQEIVPLNAGNVLVLEDSEPAAKWLAIINQALNSPQDLDGSNSDSSSGHASARPSSKDYNKSQGSLPFFQKPSLKVLSKNFRADGDLVKSCNCHSDSLGMDRMGRRQLSQLVHRVKTQYHHLDENESLEENFYSIAGLSSSQSEMNYRLVASKQMVGLFLSVWVRNELVQHVGHVRISSVGRGIMGYLGNKGCIAVSMSLHKTTFCFVCSHLASGEKEGDELRRNSDVTEILKNTQFPRVCKHPWHGMPENILNHDRVIWLGDLNYRVSLSYDEARVLLEINNWDALLERDQLNIERKAGRVFKGWKEGKIFFAPTYKYSHNSDSYAGETVKSKKKRRTPAWCDRILWHGNGIEQLFYTRGESRFSDHRPVCAVFVAEVELRRRNKNKLRKGLTAACSRMDIDNCIPQRHSLYEF